ncbi:MAG: hypothetical protein M3Y34_00380 [Actinomycetota bacterium]|nr:hypothetical protein [Actinomycetota bacterium]
MLALAACGVAIYFLVSSFTEEDGQESKRERKDRTEQAKDQRAIVPLEERLTAPV